MPVICPKCRHVRPLDAVNPDWQCPACGICYAKFDSGEPLPPRPRDVEVDVAARPGWSLGTPVKIVLLVALGWGLNLALERRNQAPDDEQVVQHEPGESASAAADAIVKVSGIDASALRQMSGRLEQACARNQYGLSEAACVARIDARGDACADSTAQAYPGQMGDTARMQVVVKAWVGCIFEA